MFRDTQKAVDFIALFRQKASYSPHKGFIWPFDTKEEDEDTTNNLETSIHSNLSPIIDDETWTSQNTHMIRNQRYLPR